MGASANLALRFDGLRSDAALDISARRSIDELAVVEPMENAMKTLSYRVWSSIVVTSIVLVAALGCGPITATQALNKAQTAIDQAKGAQADEKSPYEYFSAIQYFDKAREEEGYSDYQACIDLAGKAFEFAQMSREKALRPPENESLETQPSTGGEVPNRAPGSQLPASGRRL